MPTKSIVIVKIQVLKLKMIFWPA